VPPPPPPAVATRPSKDKLLCTEPGLRAPNVMPRVPHGYFDQQTTRTNPQGRAQDMGGKFYAPPHPAFDPSSPAKLSQPCDSTQPYEAMKEKIVDLLGLDLDL
jgi:hypothetical protein